jgi:signal transduction histidine kinase/ligand-binding sensor domain-containing protein
MFFRFLRRIAVCLTFAWVALLAVITASSALEPSTPLARLGRQVWTIENGLPQNTVPLLLQSQDGFLWVGTEVGLVRFDGLNFRVFDHSTTAVFPNAEIRCLLDGGESGLWVGTSNGLIRWRNGSAQLLSPKEGLPSNSIRGLAETSDGAVWVWTEAGLVRWDGQGFQSPPSENGLPGVGITSIAADGSGALWVGTEGGAAVFRAGHWLPGPDAAAMKEARATLHESPALVKAVSGGQVLISSGTGVYMERDGVLALVLAKSALPVDGVDFLDRLFDGTVAIASKSSMVLARGTGANIRIISRVMVSRELPGSRVESIYADHEGCLWVGTNRGLARISISAGGAAVQVLPSTDPLASHAIVSLLEDSEGDLWVGTETAGLQILRDARFAVIGSSDGLSSDATTAVAQDANHALWIGTRDAGLNRLSIDPEGKSKIASFTTANGLLSNVILSLAATPAGDVWVGTADGLNRIGHGKITGFTSADGLADDFIRSVFVAPDSSVWIGTRRGLTHMDRGRFHSYTQTDGLGSDLVGALTQTADGDLWIATLNGLTQMHQGKLHNYTVADGLSSNVITALDVTPDGRMWVGTQADGLNLWEGKRFMLIQGDGSGANRGSATLLPSAIHSIVHDDRGHLWLASDAGLTRVDLLPLLECAGQKPGPACGLNSTNVAHFTTVDGLRSQETSSNSHPTSCRTNDGKLWFTTPRGVVIADPIHFPKTPDAPPVAVERFAVDDRDMQADQAARIAAGALRFQFDYAGLSFSAPQKLRYQYMLEGFDRAWTDAGTRRTAYYTNIPPGKYRFRVRTALGDSGFADSQPYSSSNASYGSSTAQEASLSFELLPHFYQTLWFRAIVVLAIAALVVLIFRRRVLRVEREFRAVMAERNRIAREIHDTLAQGYVGISLQLEILGELLRHNRAAAAAKHLTLTQDLVREGLNDARQSIWALRSHDSREQTLPIRLRRLVEQAGDDTLTASLEVHGAYRALTTETEQETLRIAQEAIHNVKRHAAASHLRVRMDYDEHALTLSVTDDGKGFTADGKKSPAQAASAVEGHYGLTGMRERASLIRGELEIASAVGDGTIVTLKVPAPEARSKSMVRDDFAAKHSEASGTGLDKEQL